MKIIRGRPAKGKPPKIICSGCGKRAREAGVAVADDAVGNIVGPDVVIGPDGPSRNQCLSLMIRISMTIDEDEKVQPLCEECVTALERAEQR